MMLKLHQRVPIVLSPGCHGLTYRSQVHSPSCQLLQHTKVSAAPRQQVLHRSQRHISSLDRRTLCRATPSIKEKPADTADQGTGGGLARYGLSIGLLLLWFGLGYYALGLSPNQTPVRDQYFLEKLVGLGADDGVPINAVFTQLFLIMGIWPAVYAALLIPAARSGNNKVPAWPFVSASFAVGIFALLPFFAAWVPEKNAPQLPPAKESLGTLEKALESPITAAVLLLGSIAIIFQAVIAGGQQWLDYIKLFDESRFVHVTSVDFLCLTAFAPFWMSNDAQRRKWELRDQALPVLSFIPVIGPALYLLLRPRAK